MDIRETNIPGCYTINPTVYYDERGYFFESFNKRDFKRETGLSLEFVQDNQSKSSKGVLRGLHLQTGQYAQAKLVRVISGSVLDVCVDLREGSSTFGEHFSIVLNAVEHNMLYVPRGFAHGFLVLEDETIFSYKCDNFYNKSSESGIIYNDPALNIDWDFDPSEIILSDKDKELPTLEAWKK